MWRFGFFDAVEIEPGVYDRVYTAEEFSVPFAALIDTGILEGAGDSLKVTANGSSMQTTIGTGVAFILGRYAENTSPRVLTHDTEVVGLDRIDRIVIRRDLRPEARHVEPFVKKGVASTNPTPPALQRDENVYEISLAQVYIRGGQSFIGPADITDERGDEVICPWSRSKVLPHIDAQDVIDLRNEFNEHRVEIDDRVTHLEGELTQLEGELTQLEEEFEDRVDSPYVELGQNAQAKPFHAAIAIGLDATALDPQAIAIGYGADADSAGTAIGPSSSAAEAASAFGELAQALGYEAVAIGCSAVANSDYSTAIGPFSAVTAYSNNSLAIGARAVAFNSNTGVLGVSVQESGPNTWIVPGNFNVQGTKNFMIDHPHPDKKDTHDLRHGAVEAPTPGENLYRFEVEATEANQTVEVELPDYFQYLNINVQVFVSPVRHFGRAFGETEGNTLKVTCETAGKYNVMVIGTRNDENVQEWYIMGAVKEKGHTWMGETETIEVDEIMEITEFKEVDVL